MRAHTAIVLYALLLACGGGTKSVITSPPTIARASCDHMTAARTKASALIADGRLFSARQALEVPVPADCASTEEASRLKAAREDVNKLLDATGNGRDALAAWKAAASNDAAKRASADRAIEAFERETGRRAAIDLKKTGDTAIVALDREGEETARYVSDPPAAVSGDNRRVLTFDGPRGARLCTYEKQTGVLVHCIAQLPRKPRAMALSIDGKVASVFDDVALTFYRTDTGVVVRTFDGLRPIRVVFGATSVTAVLHLQPLKGFAVRTWDLATFTQRIDQSNLSIVPLGGPRYSEDGATLVFANNKTLTLVNPLTGGDLREVPFSGRVRQTAFNPSGSLLITLSEGPLRSNPRHPEAYVPTPLHICLWTVATGKKRWCDEEFLNVDPMIGGGGEDNKLEAVFDNRDTTVAVSVPSFSRTYTVANGAFDRRKEKQQREETEEQRRQTRELETKIDVKEWPSPRAPAVTAIRFSPSGAVLAVGAKDNTRLIDVTNGQVRVLAAGRDPVRIDFSADGSLALIGMSSGPRIWNIATPTPEQLPSIDEKTMRLALLLPPRGVTALTQSTDRVTVAIRDVRTGAVLKTFPPATAPSPSQLEAVDDAINEKLVVVRDNSGKVGTWDLESDARTMSQEPADLVRASPFGAVALRPRAMRDTARLCITHLQLLPPRVCELLGPPRNPPIQAFDFTSDGSSLVVARGNVVELWSTKGPKSVLETSAEHGPAPTTEPVVAVTTRRNQIFTASADGLIRVWSSRDLTPVALIDVRPKSLTAITADGRFEILIDDDDKKAKQRLTCRVGHITLPFAMCEERLATPGLLASVLRNGE